jgi:hypothetical protein
MKLRPWLQNLLLVTGAVAAVGAGGEVVTRLLWHPTYAQSVVDPHPLLGWAPRPGGRMRVVMRDRGLDYGVVVNSLGLRDRERTLRPPPGSRRVLVLGDSFVYGLGVEAEDRFTDRLERACGPGVEVVNAGVEGWGTDQEYLYLVSQGLELRPDVVVLGVCALNDVVNVMLGHALFGSTPKPHCVLRDGCIACEPPGPRPVPSAARKVVAVLEHSRFLHFTLNRLHQFVVRIRARRARLGPGGVSFPEDVDSEASEWAIFATPYSPRFEAAFQVTEALIGAMRDTCAARGIAFVLLAFPSRFEIDAEARAKELRYHGLDPARIDLGGPYARLQRLAERLGVPFVYPRGEFEAEAAPRSLFFERDAHIDAASHAIIARVLEPVLRASLAEAPKATPERTPRSP